MESAKKGKMLKTISNFITERLSNQFSKRTQENTLLISSNNNFTQKPVDRLWEIWLDKEQLLKIEFFNESDEVDIFIQNQSGDTIYELQTPTAFTLQILIDTKTWPTGIYSIQIRELVPKEKSTLHLVQTTCLLFFLNNRNHAE